MTSHETVQSENKKVYYPADSTTQYIVDLLRAAMTPDQAFNFDRVVQDNAASFTWVQMAARASGYVLIPTPVTPKSPVPGPASLKTLAAECESPEAYAARLVQEHRVKVALALLDYITRPEAECGIGVAKMPGDPLGEYMAFREDSILGTEETIHGATPLDALAKLAQLIAFS